jgi:3-hydroxyisobutyrate dehydrogenase-like beta-hydroxyacid dehydrogenase
MGRPIARRLIDAGFPLIAYNRDRTKAEELVRHGVIVAESIAALAAVATPYCPACQVMKRS